MPWIKNLLEHLELITQIALALGLGAFAWVERRRPRVPLRRSEHGDRWWTNVALYGLGLLLMWMVFDPLSALAIQAGALTGWGGLAAMPWPTAVKVLLGVLLIDLFQYVLHWGSHYIPWWWRLHKVHHSDAGLDASTAVRHHPLEVLLNGFLLVLLLAASGVPLYSILAYAALQPLHSLFCHANLVLPPSVERWLRWLLVTPGMHAVHHSVRLDEGNSNFGMVVPWWDRLFGSYCGEPGQGIAALRVGIAELERQPRPRLVGLLGLPFWVQNLSYSRKLLARSWQPVGARATADADWQSVRVCAACARQFLLPGLPRKRGECFCP